MYRIYIHCFVLCIHSVSTSNMRETCYDKTTRYNLVVFFIVYPSIFFQRFFLDDSLSEVVPFFSVCEHIVPKDSWNFVGSFFVYLRVRVFFAILKNQCKKNVFLQHRPSSSPGTRHQTGSFFPTTSPSLKRTYRFPKHFWRGYVPLPKVGYIYIFIYTYYFLGR